ncbi:uncharacterized protein LOC131931042 isoform X2 [Physella acuta]|nr:uncharacterized protein LOC131931042 isoform X2 [Physella acuta]XP_059143710.1 uncharacterized protein LOC131931042 isoform X2 [Physella acuta]XP_059143712.1 uncharacterized protein LOC131931042 isoform X2 [Physella acuta]XP_059143713.1 uncharacterized protein LOC131931042 isoform X2 [Physella acuta]
MSLAMALRSKLAYRTLVCHQHDLASSKISFFHLYGTPTPAYKFVLSSKTFRHCSIICRKFTTFVCYYSSKKENPSMTINPDIKKQDNFIEKSYIKLLNLIQPPAVFSKSVPIKTHHKDVLLNSVINVDLTALENPSDSKSTEETTFISENSKSEYNNITSNLNETATDNCMTTTVSVSHSINHSKIKYPLRVPCKSKPVKTELFEDMQNFLTCLGIPCEELEFYPDIQRMSNNDILDCLTVLKNVGIHKVFSLFLINSAHQLIKASNSSSSQVRNMKKIISIRQVKTYLKLCQALQKPDLDIRSFLCQLAEVGIYDDMNTVLNKVQKLQSIGATAHDILSNLGILQGHEFFDSKINVYKSTRNYSAGPFPVSLFLTPNLNSFKAKLGLNIVTEEIATLLGVDLAVYQECFGHCEFKINDLKYKIRMCLTAGISQQEIFNNLRILNRLPMQKCYDVSSCFRSTGLPASVTVMSDIKHTMEQNCSKENRKIYCDNESICEETGNENVSSPNSKGGKKKAKVIMSSKRRRKDLFYFIRHLLKLDGDVVTTMFECSIDVSSIELPDVSKNLEYLLSLGFTKSHISACPLILANNQESLIRVTKKANQLVSTQLHSPLSSVSATLVGNQLATIDLPIFKSYAVYEKQNDLTMKNLFSCPIKHLHTLQYLLEKENSFSLRSSESQVLSTSYKMQ